LLSGPVILVQLCLVKDSGCYLLPRMFCLCYLFLDPSNKIISCSFCWMWCQQSINIWNLILEQQIQSLYIFFFAHQFFCMTILTVLIYIATEKWLEPYYCTSFDHFYKWIWLFWYIEKIIYLVHIVFQAFSFYYTVR
jgi:hypothetical protein